MFRFDDVVLCCDDVVLVAGAEQGAVLGAEQVVGRVSISRISGEEGIRRKILLRGVSISRVGWGVKIQAEQARGGVRISQIG